jgi:hypothetical protein
LRQRWDCAPGQGMGHEAGAAHPAIHDSVGGCARGACVRGWPPARRLVTVPPLRAGRPRPQGRACLPPAAVAAAPPSLHVDQGEMCGSKVVSRRLAGMGGSPCESLSHATYPDEGAQRGQRAGDRFPVGVSVGAACRGRRSSASVAAWRISRYGRASPACHENRVVERGRKAPLIFAGAKIRRA